MLNRDLLPNKNQLAWIGLPEIMGIVAGSLVLFLAVAAGVVFYGVRKRNRAQSRRKSMYVFTYKDQRDEGELV